MGATPGSVIKPFLLFDKVSAWHQRSSESELSCSIHSEDSINTLELTDADWRPHDKNIFRKANYFWLSACYWSQRHWPHTVQPFTSMAQTCVAFINPQKWKRLKSPYRDSYTAAGYNCLPLPFSCWSARLLSVLLVHHLCLGNLHLPQHVQHLPCLIQGYRVWQQHLFYASMKSKWVLDSSGF